MEGIRGSRSYTIDRAELLDRVSARAGVLIDLGTGDGRYVAHIARTRPDWLAVGIDACRENLRDHSRRAPPNALYLIANALALPPEVAGLATCVTINFPWGSLLGGLLGADAGLLCGLTRLASDQMDLEIRLNGDALREHGWELEPGGKQIVGNLCDAGFVPHSSAAVDAAELAAMPSTWARRLAHGREPRGWCLALSARALAVPRTPGSVNHP